ncbi:MAG: FadR family transcriptional regulator [Alicyclobacillus herbarius]|uniref:FadR/GntR family transcriptional regulator n=1 Tax=Alicyclobacillus herbarius TaxID=122960 RepID=UPI0003F6AE20|nr:FadR/GntR family transcriptional regulator [Alicyclobacillus herbarius]MCL6631352.1 FadR family transcriptional regulator [Alicyclobacillus herbarius]
MPPVQADEHKLYYRIAQQIRGMIEEGVLRPGDRLPPLAELAEQFGCSRATVREALGALRGQGLVEFRHGNGTYVRTAAVQMWMEPLEAALLLGQGEIRQLLEAMTALLAGIASVAAARAEETDFAPLTQAMFQVECAYPRGEDAIAADMAFYLTLAACSGNEVLENALRVTQEALRSALRLVADEWQSGVNTCRAVYDAVLAGDAHRAREILYAYGQTMVQRIESRTNGS